MAKSPAGDVWVWLRLELGLTEATGSIWSLVGGIREPGWAKSPVPDVGGELGLTRTARSVCSLLDSEVETSFSRQANIILSTSCMT